MGGNKMNIGSKYRAFNLVVVFAALMLLMFLSVGCGNSEPDADLDDDLNTDNFQIAHRYLKPRCHSLITHE